MKVRGKTLRERFDAKGFGVVKYARAHGLSRVILSNVLSEREDTAGTRRTQRGETRKVYAQLKKDGVWIGALPWEVKDDNN